MSSRSAAECDSWVERVHSVQVQRMTPEQRAELQARTEQSREQTRCARKARAVQNHTRRSHALCSEALRQMSSGHDTFAAVQGRWESAQMMSTARQDEQLAFYQEPCRGAGAAASAPAAVAVLRDDSEDEAEDLLTVGRLVGAEDVALLAHSTEEPSAGGRRVQAGGAEATAQLLEQLRAEPQAEEECAAKFALYEGYGRQVEGIRSSLLGFHEESRPSLPPQVAADMDRRVRGIDSQEAMGVPEDSRAWFVYHMMRQAERNNRSMSQILRDFEAKLRLLAEDAQRECPVCLEDFQEAGGRAAETLSCCHKVCQECWGHWIEVARGSPFCPLCRNGDFVSLIAARHTERA